MTDQRRRAADKDTPKEHIIAKDLEEWKKFSTDTFEAGERRMKSIEANQLEYIEVLKATKSDVHAVQRGLAENTRITSDLSNRYEKQETGIGDLLNVMNAINGTKKTAWWAGKGLIFTAGVVGAWEVIKPWVQKFFHWG